MKTFDRIHFDAISLREIDPGTRFREDYGDIDSLSESFDIAGMMHDLSLREHPNPTDGFMYELVAGGRRYWALIRNGEKTAPAYVYYNLNDEDYRLMERIENAQRKAMDWKEDAKLIAEIHRLQQERHGAPERRQAATEGQWTRDDSAEFFGRSTGAISDSIKLAEALDKHPELAGCEKASQARSMLKSIERNANAKIIAEKQLLDEQDASRASILEPCYLVGDALEGLKGIQPSVADLFEIDPPYGIAYDKRSASASNTTTYTDVDENLYETFIETVLSEAYRIAKPNSWCLLWHDIGRCESLRLMMENIGWKVCKMPLIWNKIIPGVLSNPGLRLAHTYEAALYAYKGNPKIVATGHSDVFSVLSVRDQYRIHPTERPIDLMVDVLKTFAEPGSTVVSPFLGSGVTLAAAYELGMNCFGWDLEQSNKDKFIVKCNNWRGYNRKELEDASV